MIGSDGVPSHKHPHPRLWGSFPRVLARYVRELGILTLPEAVRRMTSLPAKVFGLDKRGVLAVGNYADLVVFDADLIADMATFQQPTVPAAGIHMVITNGKPVWVRGVTSGCRPGRLLRRTVRSKGCARAP
jgi:N-acyl-D-amino-acid deacylase